MVKEEKCVIAKKSYLAERTQIVSFFGYELTYEKVDLGVPQGSKQYQLRVLNFADDTLLYTTLKKNIYAGQ